MGLLSSIFDRSPPPGWHLALQSIKQEIHDPVRLEVRGRVPEEIAGTLYRIGPGRFDVFGERYRHLFDGDGAIHAFSIRDGAVDYRCRFVQQRAYVEEQRAHKRLYGAFGTSPPGGFLRRFFRRHRRRNPANTSVVFQGGRLFALCEAGRPHEIDPLTLETRKEDDLNGLLDTPKKNFSAHPRLDPHTLTLWGFGVEYGRHTQLHLYRLSASGEPERAASLPMPLPAFVHDFALTESKIVVLVAPYVLPTPPLALMLGQRTIGQSLRYRPELCAHVGIIDRQSFAARWVKTDPFLFYHIINAHDQDEEIIADVCAYEDGRITESFYEMMTGRVRRGGQRAYPTRLHLKKDGTVTRSRISEHHFEFPLVLPSRVSRPHQVAFGLTWKEADDIPRRPARLDVQSGKLETAPLGDNEWASECVPIPKAGAQSEADAWLLTVVLDASTRRSELRLLDGAQLDSPPVMTAALPQIVPQTFHGCFVSAAR